MDIFDKIKYYGDARHWSGSLEHSDGVYHGVELRECQFCGSEHQVISNTHSPYYIISCECGIELNPCFIASNGESYADLDGGGGLFKSKEQAKRQHEEALQHIINKWNGTLPPDFYQEE